jgi:hypothetical protein
MEDPVSLLVLANRARNLKLYQLKNKGFLRAPCSLPQHTSHNSCKPYTYHVTWCAWSQSYVNHVRSGADQFMHAAHMLASYLLYTDYAWSQKQHPEHITFSFKHREHSIWLEHVLSQMPTPKCVVPCVLAHDPCFRWV